MYLNTLYVQTEKSEKPLLSIVLRSYLINSGSTGILLSPGYFCGNRTNVLTSTDIRDLLDYIFFPSKIKYIGIINSMVNKKINEYEDLLSSHYGFDVIKLNRSCKSDHRKMAFIFDVDKSNIPSCLTKDNADRFVNDVNLNAVLIGSSNFSYTTYMGQNGGTANKGEADIIMFKNTTIRTKIERDIREYNADQYNYYFSKSDHEVPDNFLENIMIKTLEKSLI